MRFVHTFLVSNASVSIFGPIIDHKVITATAIVQKRTRQGSAIAFDPEFETVSLDEEYILAAERPQKR